MKSFYNIIGVLFFVFTTTFVKADNRGIQRLFEKGWAELTKDNDVLAFNYFSEGLDSALVQNNLLFQAEALLNMAICSYGVSYTQGMDYCLRAMNSYKALEHTLANKAVEGRSRCLQLISTLKGRQGKYREAIALSKQAMASLVQRGDTTGTLGLVFNSLGVAYSQLGMKDSSVYFHQRALEERLLMHTVIYLPGSYIAIGDIELQNRNEEKSKFCYLRALAIADSTENRQAQVLSLLALGKWCLVVEKNAQQAASYYEKAKSIASNLSDKYFYLKALEHLVEMKMEQKDFNTVADYQGEIIVLKDSLNVWEKQKTLRSLEVQFSVSEKEKMLELLKKEKSIAKLTNYLLWLGLLFICLLFLAVVWFLKRINKRDKLLLQTKDALVKSTEEQRLLKEQQLKNDIEYKESQLTAMTLQMIQKNELLQELKEKLEEDDATNANKAAAKIIGKGLNQDKEWSDFNTYFESINKNFYSRIKQSYTDISPNELKICALIKMNLSSKEMASILNISPDSVKTARYRLRKKLQLSTEDNLTDFILNLK